MRTQVICDLGLILTNSNIYNDGQRAGNKSSKWVEVLLWRYESRATEVACACTMEEIFGNSPNTTDFVWCSRCTLYGGQNRLTYAHRTLTGQHRTMYGGVQGRGQIPKC